MTERVVVSIAIKSNILAVTLSANGALVKQESEKCKTDTNNYGVVLDGLTKGLRFVRQYIQDNQDAEEIVFEVSSATVIGWVQNQYAKDMYQERFDSVMELLNEIPIRYAFVHNPKPKAIMYTDKRYCKKQRMESLL